MGKQKQSYRKYTFGISMWVLIPGLFFISLAGGILTNLCFWPVCIFLMIWDSRYREKKKTLMALERVEQAKWHMDSLLQMVEEEHGFASSNYWLVGSDALTGLCIDAENKRLAMMQLAENKRVVVMDFRKVRYATIRESRYEVKLAVEIEGSLEDPFEVLLYRMTADERQRGQVSSRSVSTVTSKEKVRERGHVLPSETVYVKGQVTGPTTYHTDHSRHSKQDKQWYAEASARAKEWQRLLNFYITHWNPNDNSQPHTFENEALVLQTHDVRHAAQVQAAPAEEGASVSEELAKLADLMEQGYLTREEFEAQKKKILAR